MPSRTAARIIAPCVFKYSPRSSTLIPSTPGAPWWRLTWWSARRRCWASRIRSRRFFSSTGASSPRVPAMASSPGVPRSRSSGLPDALPPLDPQRLRLSCTPLAGHRSGLQPTRGAARPLGGPACRPWGASRALPASSLLCPRLTSADRSERIAPPSVPFDLDNRQISQGKTPSCPRVDAGFIKYTQCADGGLRGHVPTRPGWSHPSSPVPVRRPARVDGASSRRHLAMTPLPCSSPSAPLTPGTGTSTPLALCHAWHTRPMLSDTVYRVHSSVC